MIDTGKHLIGVGIYSVPEASNLTKISAGRIRRWLRGHSYSSPIGTKHASSAVFAADLAPIDHALALSFLDLMEVRFVDAFITHGVSWKNLREAHRRAREAVGHAHPFTTGKFHTDGRRILLDLAQNQRDGALLDIVKDQYAFKRLVVPFLKNVDFATSATRQALRWWPLGKRRQIVLDPHRSFGQAIVAREGVPAAVLARAYEAEAAVEPADAVVRVARWFRVERDSVRDAVAWETNLLRAA